MAAPIAEHFPLNLSEDHYIAALLPAITRCRAVLAERLISLAQSSIVLSSVQRETAKVVFKPYFGVKRAEGQKRCVPDLAIFVAGTVILLEFKFFSTQTYRRIAKQLQVHRQAVEQDWPEKIRTSNVLLCLIGPEESPPPGAVGTLLSCKVAYLGWRELAALVLDPVSEKPIGEELSRALSQWSSLKTK